MCQSSMKYASVEIAVMPRRIYFSATRAERYIPPDWVNSITMRARGKSRRDISYTRGDERYADTREICHARISG